MRILMVFLTLVCFYQTVLQAAITMPVLFGDGMVFQRQAPIRIFGQATDGSQITVELADQVAITTAKAGQWRVELKAMPAGGPYELRVSDAEREVVYKDVMLGEVWLAGGQSNMAQSLKHTLEYGKYLPKKVLSELRYIKIPVTEFGEINRKRVSWQRFDSESSLELSAVAYYFARELQKRLGEVTVAIIGSYRGGTWNENWMTPESIKKEPPLRHLFEKYDIEYSKFENEAAYEEAYREYLVKLKEWRKKGGWSHGRVPFAPLGPKAYQRPAGLYECMIQPLQPYTIKGVIWYQGEGNSGRYQEFRTLFPAFIEGWRKTWENPNLPFYFVQLPGYKDESWPNFRQAQLDCFKKIEHCGMVVSEGCGDKEDIHPKTKKPIGDRLAIAVSSEVYGQPHVPYGPVFKRVEYEGKLARVSFDYVGKGLSLKTKSTQAFEIAGSDNNFKPAHYKIENNQLVLWNDTLDHPRFVRYAFSPNPDMCLFNGDGLPASPFTSEMLQ